MINYPDRPQYILWKSVDADVPGVKPRKVPCDATGREMDPHLPANWMEHDQADALAASTEFLTGFVLTADDPYFLIDLDNCRDPVTGAYTDAALNAHAVMQSCMFEVSHSGAGIHYLGTCEAGLDEVYMNRADGIEFYQRKRFVAIGTNQQGDATVDMTDQLRTILKPRADLHAIDLPADGAVPEYTGPTDDNELLMMAMQARGSIASQFGESASFADLWNGLPDVMAKHYAPDNTSDAFNRSGADAALLAQLAFWTGKDQKRMYRLWLASPLAKSRPDQKKLHRADYVNNSIQGASRLSQAVYSKPRVAVTISADVTVATDAPVKVPGTDIDITFGGYMTVFQQHDYFAGCVYVANDKKIMTPLGRMLDGEQFKVMYSGPEFQMTADGSKPTRDAWSAFTTSGVYSFPKVDERRFSPDYEFGHVGVDVQSGASWVNKFKPCNWTRVENADASPYLDLLRRILPDERDQRIYISWCAAMVQNPGRKFKWAIVMQGAQGNGKSFLLEFLTRAVGEHMTHKPNARDMDQIYNAYMADSLLIAVEEVDMKGTAIAARLLTYITERRIEIRAMRTDPYTADNLTNWIFLTNHKDAVPITNNDRRYAIMYSAQQSAVDIERVMPQSFFATLDHWAHQQDGWNHVTTFLHDYQVDPEFDPLGACKRAPETSSKAEAIVESRSFLENFIAECIEEEQQGLMGGWVSSYRLQALLKQQGFKPAAPKTLGAALRSLGYEKCAAHVAGRPSKIETTLDTGGKMRTVLYCLEPLNDARQTASDYLMAQGLIEPAAPVAVPAVTGIPGAVVMQ